MGVEEDHHTALPYSHAEWAHSNLGHYQEAEAARQRSETLRNEAVRLVEDRQVRTTRTQADASSRLNERARDVASWKKDLQREVDALVAEMATLEVTRQELEHAIAQAKRPEEVALHCLTAREYRVGVDVVADAVQAALAAELAEVRRVQGSMAQHHDDIQAQALHMAAVLDRLRHDLRQKIEALDIDQTCFSLENSSHEVTLHPGVHQADLCASDPQAWIKFSDKNIEEANTARVKSGELRGAVTGLLASACTELMTAWSVCNRSFKERIQETEEAQGLLANNLQNTAQELTDLDDHIAILKKALEDKKPPLKVAETRLANRSHRPNIEACDDDPQGKLISEVVELNDSIALLSSKLADAEDCRAQLVKARTSLRSELRVKENSLRIDRGKCLGQRLRFPYNQRCSRKCQYKWCQHIATYTMVRAAEGLHLADTDLRQHDGGHAA